MNKFAYVRLDGRVLTVARRLDKETGNFFVGWSVCMPGDNFSKKVGRELAVERMKFAGNVNDSDWRKNFNSRLWIAAMEFVVQSSNSGDVAARLAAHALEHDDYVPEVKSNDRARKLVYYFAYGLLAAFGIWAMIPLLAK